ncbi:hypothetical protein [Pontibaca salina]|uniref:Uncharacterized protein n=1 Tax=Pontibaca salina TaxID=2795731 RepID=A0A934HUN7_9RHOB|nr:hypothetical protein [Pontibaca salina]MBI6629874.1 hypothetical protein [Pontibaca salina]
MALLTLGGLGLLLLRVALVATGGVWVQIVLIGLALTFWALAGQMWRATALSVELHEGGLRDSAGTVLVRFDGIEMVERGNFALKPSQGFVVRTALPGPFAWRPGLWWRIGRRVGVGGVVSASQTKQMATLLDARLAARLDQ